MPKPPTADPDRCEVFIGCLSTQPSESAHTSLQAGADLVAQNQWLAYIRELKESDDLASVTARLAQANAYNREFCWSTSFDASFIRRLVYEGYLPMADRLNAGQYALLPKLHQKRSCMHPREVHTQVPVSTL